ncbi:MAG: toll/interleukin-1 receptor domain-containing protein [Chloroflexi bacterium]|nr:toll/interleukin-1 receptor domain-containing protein [Chloroflexota bacterium]
MTQIFLSHSPASLGCAGQLRRDLDASGYVVWKNHPNMPAEAVGYGQAMEAGIRGSAAVVVVWNAQAAQSEWVEREILYAQRLKKAICLIHTDDTGLPNTLVHIQELRYRGNCQDLASLLLPYLPAPGSQDALVLLLGQISHPQEKVRKAGIDRAAQLLVKGVHREPVLALLEELSQKDEMRGVQEKAQAVREADARRRTITPRLPLSPADSRHTIGVRCRHNHISYFAKHRICPAKSSTTRTVLHRGGMEVDEIHLKCQVCGEDMVVRVDCQGYK